MGVISLRNTYASVQFFHMDDKNILFPQEHIAIGCFIILLHHGWLGCKILYVSLVQLDSDAAACHVHQFKYSLKFNYERPQT